MIQDLSLRSLSTIILLSSLLLEGCHIGNWDVKYPADWATPENVAEHACPTVAGVYVNEGERRLSAAGADCYNDCGSLISELIDEGGIMNLWKKSMPPLERTIEIRQPTNETLVITEWQSVNAKRESRTEVTLSVVNGDFECESGELRLKMRTHFVILLIGNAIVTESRVFYRLADGSLVMKRLTRAGGHVLVFPEAYAVGEWIRWQPAAAMHAFDENTKNIYFEKGEEEEQEERDEKENSNPAISPK